MQVLQRESGRVVAPGGSPIGSCVTGGTLRCWESGRRVIRYRAAKSCRAVPFSLMATVTIGIGRREIVIVVDVAIRAGCRAVNAGKRPACGAVIKRRGGPGDCIVAGRAIRGCKGSTRSGVCRIVGLLPGREVTSGVAAIVRLDRKSVIAVDVTGGTTRDFACGCELVRVG